MESDAADVEYEFHCPDCGEELVVNDAMKEALVERGCVICTADIDDDAFDQI